MTDYSGDLLVSSSAALFQHLWPTDFEMFQVSTAATITVPGSPVTSIETTSTVLECTYTATSSNPLISWYKGSSTSTGSLIIQKDNAGVYNQPAFTRYDIQDQASLLITDTQLSDADKYWCQVEGLSDP
uniref:Uncharacterized protein LOC102804849 n=1 Tax=Saccoglossus kowalevskii TaxID=10224 RepID=A0ABM0M5Q6_SACKO|nr:PREDICTED: uncharacterized protein LOC102804849 [Saccoglossus kowalevskii]